MLLPRWGWLTDRGEIQPRIGVEQAGEIEPELGKIGRGKFDTPLSHPLGKTCWRIKGFTMRKVMRTYLVLIMWVHIPEGIAVPGARARLPASWRY